MAQVELGSAFSALHRPRRRALARRASASASSPPLPLRPFRLRPSSCASFLASASAFALASASAFASALASASAFGLRLFRAALASCFAFASASALASCALRSASASRRFARRPRPWLRRRPWRGFGLGGLRSGGGPPRPWRRPRAFAAASALALASASACVSLGFSGGAGNCDAARAPAARDGGVGTSRFRSGAGGFDSWTLGHLVGAGLGVGLGLLGGLLALGDLRELARGDHLDGDGLLRFLEGLRCPKRPRASPRAAPHAPRPDNTRPGSDQLTFTPRAPPLRHFFRSGSVTSATLR